MGLQPAAGGAPPAEAAPAGAGACAAGALGLPPAGGPFAAIGGTAWGCSVLGMVVCVQRLIYRSNCSTLLSVLRWVYGGSRSTKPRSRRVDSSRAAKRPQASKELAVPKALQLSHTHTPWRPQKPKRSWSGRKTMKLKIKLLKGGDFEMEIDAAKKVRHPERRSHASPSRAAAALLPGH